MTALYKNITLDGLWTNNPALVQVLGLCPLMAISTNAVNALGLGFATLLTLAISNVLISCIRNTLQPEIRIPVFVLVIACVVTAIQLAMKAYFHDLYKILGIFIPLIVTNCIIIARAEAFAAKNRPFPAFIDGVMMGIGSTAVLFALGSLREILGQGTWFAQAHLMFGDTSRWITVTLFKDYEGLLLAVLPPGAFIGLGLLIALKNIIDARAKKRKEHIALGVAGAQTA
jgi:electron transport complex protein RnfE